MHRTCLEVAGTWYMFKYLLKQVLVSRDNVLPMRPARELDTHRIQEGLSSCHLLRRSLESLTSVSGTSLAKPWNRRLITEV